MTPENLFYAEINLSCSVILLLLARKLRRVDKSIEQAYLIALLIGQSILFLFDSFWVLIDSDPTYPPLVNSVLNVMYFTSTTACAYLCMRYIYLSLCGKIFSLRSKILLQLPIWISAYLSLSSVWTGWIFTVSAGNVYRRGPLYALQFVIPLVYMLSDSIAAMYIGLHTQQTRIRKKAFTFAFILILPVVGSFLELLIPSLTIVAIFVTVSMISVIFDFQQQQITRDSLTQLSNRCALMQHLEERLAHPAKGNIYLIFADIDYFKSINDTYGHLEGDHALCYVADALRTVCRSSDAFPARISGDEFVIVFTAKSDATAEKFRDSVKEAVLHVSGQLPYRLAISAGLARSTEADRENASAFLDRADAALYEDKKKRPSKTEKAVSDTTA